VPFLPLPAVPLPTPPPLLFRPPFGEPGRFNLPDPNWANAPQPGANPDKVRGCPPCASVKRPPKKKGTCRQGYFREYPDRTEYITWSKRKCP
jgi:hypothetical protein